MASIRLSVKFTRPTLEVFSRVGLEVDWSKALNNYEFPWRQSMSVEDIATLLEQVIVNFHNDPSDEIQVQIRAISVGDKALRFDDYASQYMKSGDTLLVDAMAVSARQMQRRRPQWSESALEKVRKKLRFDLNDRVLCYCGPRWLSATIVGTAVVDPEDGELLPYLAKTDPLPGLPARTISVPSDHDGCCTQEICFDPEEQLHLVKAAAALPLKSGKPQLRFAVGDNVVCRIHNNPKDGLEQWVRGVVRAIWPKLSGGEDTWSLGDVSGKFPEEVPYQIDIASGRWLYCHKDVHTLIRQPGMEPETRVKGMSKRMELRVNKDGTRDRIDHATGRKKRLASTAVSDSD